VSRRRGIRRDEGCRDEPDHDTCTRTGVSTHSRQYHRARHASLTLNGRRGRRIRGSAQRPDATVARARICLRRSCCRCILGQRPVAVRNRNHCSCRWWYVGRRRMEGSARRRISPVGGEAAVPRSYETLKSPLGPAAMRDGRKCVDTIRGTSRFGHRWGARHWAWDLHGPCARGRARGG